MIESCRFFPKNFYFHKYKILNAKVSCHTVNLEIEKEKVLEFY